MCTNQHFRLGADEHHKRYGQVNFHLGMPQEATYQIVCGKFDVSEYDIIREEPLSIEFRTVPLTLRNFSIIKKLKARGGTRKQEEDQ